MRIHDQGAFVRVTFSSSDTYQFGSRWPCSGFRGDRLSVTLDASNGDLVKLSVNGRDADLDCSAVDDIVSDALRTRSKWRHLAR